MSSSAALLAMFTLAVILFSCCTFSFVEGTSKCDNAFLSSKCKNLFKGNYDSECHGEALQLFPKCLYMASECKTYGQITDTAYVHSANANFSEAYDALMKKVQLYRSCFSRNAWKCNESKIKECYKNFDRNSTEICRDVHKLRLCVLVLRPRGCHEMRNPWYTVASGIIKQHKSCFIQNYTVVLGVLHKTNKSRSKPRFEIQGNFSTIPPKTHVVDPGSAKRKWSIGYKLFGSMFVCFLIIVSAILLFVCIKRSGLSSKSTRGLMPIHGGNGATALNLLDVRETRTCSSSNGAALTFVINDEEAPPPYVSHENGFLIGNVDSPPPYTSRPTSVNGDFV